jgi:membrane associated rhomboid family serine protease
MAVVRRIEERSEAELQALVLRAQGIDCEIIEDRDGFRLLVSPERLAEADAELRAFEAENASAKRGTAPAVRHRAPIEIVLVYWAVMLFFFAAARRDFLSIDWLDIGSAQTGLIREGQLWRSITALFLHVSGAHLLSNLVFGSLFLLLLTQILGWGVTALGVLLAGAGGNLLNAMVRPPFHDSIGASTALFGAIGLLAALRQNWRERRGSLRFRFWVPVAAGLMLLALLGASGERTDILAHLFGFLVGLCLGVFVFLLRSRRPDVNRLQWPAAAMAVALIGAAWIIAILAR